nr:unnamed protein product [Callosobruchus analis]
MLQPPPGMFPGVAPGQFPGSPFGLPPPGFPTGAWPPGAAPHQPPIDPEIVARASDWTEHKAPDGRPYYHNAKRGESVWEKPQALKDLESKFFFGI